MYAAQTWFFLPWLYPGVLWKVPVIKDEIFLTFDDGPTPGVTEPVLDCLDVHKAKAVFFCLGSKVAQHPELARDILRRGHLIGNHTWSHPDGWKTGHPEYLSDLIVAQQEISRQTGSVPRFFRPPYGRFTRRMLAQLPDGMRTVMWDVMPGDFDRKQTGKNCLRRALKFSRAGSIVVFHDSLQAGERLLEVLPQFLSHFQSRGFTFPLLPESR